MVTIGKQEMRVSVPAQAVALVVCWVAAIAMETASSFDGSTALGRWAILVTGAAASWTAVFGVKRVISSTAQCVYEHLVEDIEELMEACTKKRGPAVADEVMRRLELRELEQQVARLVPRQPSPSQQQ